MTRRIVLALAAIVVVGFLARARMVMATQHLVLSGDPADYDRLGRLLAAGKGFGTSVLSPSGGPTAFRPPLYPLFLGAVYKVTGGSMTAARLVQAVLGNAIKREADSIGIALRDEGARVVLEITEHGGIRPTELPEPPEPTTSHLRALGARLSLRRSQTDLVLRAELPASAPVT